MKRLLHHLLLLQVAIAVLSTGECSACTVSLTEDSLRSGASCVSTLMALVEVILNWLVVEHRVLSVCYSLKLMQS